MSIDTLKLEVNSLDDRQRRQLMAYLVGLEMSKDAEHAAEMARRMDDKDPSHWVTLEEMDRRLGLASA